ncbi:unnamed protein product, partial [Mesorhabditis belari]|uniref:GB1/RHD3-type G domain-containing protein n=1 Tax=Mesorhabditis belari TaxID=2138241 RepID=A0AAF3EKP0_9BILA
MSPASTKPANNRPFAVPVVTLEEVKSSSLHSSKTKTSYKLNDTELMKILGRSDLVNKKVAVISIAGAFRKGKSYMLNFFVNYLESLSEGKDGVEWLTAETPLDKFHWRSGSKRDTSGIFLWSQPFILRDKHGDEIVLLLMDTQGTFDHKTTMNDLSTIFALSTLLSSVQIVNVSQQIQEDDLSNLRLFTEFAQLAQSSTQDENRHQVAPFQKLLFLIRDWPNSEEFDYGYEGGNEYLQNVLAIKPKQGKQLQKLRESIKASFESLEAFLMPHPGRRVANNNSDKVFGEVEPDFEEHLQSFVVSHFEEDILEAKTVQGEELSCGELMKLFRTYMKIFNSDKLPKVKTILEATAEVMNGVAETKAKNEYDSLMKEKITGAEPNLAVMEILHRFHTESVDAVMKVWENRPTMNSDISVQANRDNLRAYFEARYAEHKQAVEQNAKLAIENRRIEAERARFLEEDKLAKQKNKEEQERLARDRAEQEEKFRREREDIEKKRRIDEEKIRQQQLEQQREAERLRQEQQRIEAQRIEAQRIEAQRQQEQRRIEIAQAAAMRSHYSPSFSSTSIYYSPSPSPSHGSSNFRSSPSPSHGSSNFRSSPSPSHGSSNLRPEQYTTRAGNTFTRYRDQWGRFAKKE